METIEVHKQETHRLRTEICQNVTGLIQRLTKPRMDYLGRKITNAATTQVDHDALKQCNDHIVMASKVWVEYLDRDNTSFQIVWKAIKSLIILALNCIR